jgi:serine/threonine protein kinase
MSAHLDVRHSSTPKAWAPKTIDLDGGATGDLQDGGTADMAEVCTEDVPLDTPVDHTDTATTEVIGATATMATPIGPEHTSTTPAPARAEPAPTPARSAHVSPGAVLKERYLIEQVLGAGGTAWVFRARDLTLDQQAPGARIAIKMPRPDVKDRTRAVARLQHEFKHAQGLVHPNIARVVALESDDQTWFMTMELIEGRSLATLMREPDGLPDTLKRAVLTSCAQALAYAHSKDIVHGDFKPANVIVGPSGQVKVFDFGAAASLEGEDTRIPAGTPAYASPQVLSGDKPDPRDDVFSFACVAYELLTGNHPFERLPSLEARAEGKTPARAWNLSAPQWLALLSALSWEREERPADIVTLAQKLLADAPAVPRAPQAPLAPSQPAAPADPADDLMPTQRSWGFFVFIAVALAVMLFAARRESIEPDTADAVPSAQATAETIGTSALGNVAPSGTRAPEHLSLPTPPPANDDATETGTSPEATPAAPATSRSPPKASPPALDSIGFESASITTSESAIAAVLIVHRTGSLDGRAVARWRATSGTAQIDEDFITSPTGTVEFADGQAQRALYIPLRNDQLAEGDETFSIELIDAQRARLGSVRVATVTIKDDD